METASTDPKTAPVSASAQFKAYQANRHFGSLDGLRFLCILPVLWHHGPLSGSLREIYSFFGRGFVGVDFFFVLSGFLITTLLLREEKAKGRFDIKGFYWRRILRIIPIYFFVVTIVAIYVFGVKGETDKLHLLPYYYLFLSNFLTDHLIFLDPTWSLSVEEQYYLIWPALLLLVPRRWIIPLLIGLVAVNVAGIIGVFAAFGITPFEVGPLRIALPNATYAPILMGSLVAMGLNHRAVFDRVAPLLSGRATPWLAFGSIVLALALMPPDQRGIPNLILHLLMCLALTTLVVREDNGMRGVLTRPLIARIGQISYGIYLYHLFALHIANAVLGKLGLSTDLSVFALYMILSVIIAEISFRTLERFFLRFR